MPEQKTRVLVEAALTIALAAALHFVRVWQMPAGGTVSLQMLPLFVFALRRGWKAGVLAGALYGLIDLQLEPYVIHWAQLLLDYPVAFAGVGLAGLWSDAWRARASAGRWTSSETAVTAMAVMTGAAARYLAHFVSGVIFFATVDLGGPLAKGASAFADPGAFARVALYSAVYNLYVPVSAAGCLVALAAIMPALQRGLPVGPPRSTNGGTSS